MTENVALVTHEGKVWKLTEGGCIAYGREETRPIRIRDPRISSRAGLLFLASGCVWLRHDSGSHAVTVLPRTGEPRLVPVRSRGWNIGVPEPLPGVGTRLRMVGRLKVVEIDIDSSGLTGPAVVTPDPDADPAGTDPTESIRGELTDEERVLLAALAEPLLKSHGVGRSQSTKEAAVRLDMTYRQVENRLVALRVKLTGLGVEGLLRDEVLTPGASASANFVAVLGLQAFAHGWASLEDLPRPRGR